jgi:hypothetical protein
VVSGLLHYKWAWDTHSELIISALDPRKLVVHFNGQEGVWAANTLVHLQNLVVHIHKLFFNSEALAMFRFPVKPSSPASGSGQNSNLPSLGTDVMGLLEGGCYGRSVLESGGCGEIN